MPRHEALTRRSFLTAVAVAPLAAAAQPNTHIPVGLELYSVRNDLQKDLTGTVKGVAKMGYECVEFFSPYYDWTPDYAKQVRQEMDDLGIHCYSTHNSLKSFNPYGTGKANELNQILGTRYIVLAHTAKVTGVDGWKQVA
jgi:sugar phosphate isomerase/epimerase